MFLNYRYGLKSCLICLGEPKDPVCLPCSHVFCQKCIRTWLVPAQMHCPYCRVAMGDVHLNVSVELRYSTLFKVEALQWGQLREEILIHASKVVNASRMGGGNSAPFFLEQEQVLSVFCLLFQKKGGSCLGPCKKTVVTKPCKAKALSVAELDKGTACRLGLLCDSLAKISQYMYLASLCHL